MINQGTPVSWRGEKVKLRQQEEPNIQFLDKGNTKNETQNEVKVNRAAGVTSSRFWLVVLNLSRQMDMAVGGVC